MKGNITPFLYVVGGSLFIALFAQLTIPLPYVPITGQSLAVLLTAYALRSRLGSAAVLLYLILGAIGLPVFAECSGGIEHLTGKTGGYLIGFLPAAFVCGKLAENQWDQSYIKSVLAMALGTTLILLFGFTYLAQFIGWSKGWVYGIVKVLPGAVIKILLGASILPLYHYLTSQK